MRQNAPLPFLTALGAVSSVMMRSPIYCQYPVACLAEWIRPAILLGQYQLFHDHGENLVGYMTWALLSKEVEERLIHDPALLLHISEWNEGERLWVMDFVVLNQDVRRFVRVARERLKEYRQAKSLRRCEDGVVRKTVIWRLNA